MSRSRRYRGTPVPPLHLVQIYVAGMLVIMAGAAYFYAPAGKAETFAGVMLTLVGFLTGKFSNGFGKPIPPRELDADGDGEADEPAPVAPRKRPATEPV